MSSNFEQMSIIPTLVITPMVFLGGSLYSLDMLPPFWQTVSYFNPVVYLINGLRFSFYGVSDFNIWISIGSMVFFLVFVYLVSVLLKKVIILNLKKKLFFFWIIKRFFNYNAINFTSLIKTFKLLPISE